MLYTINPQQSMGCYKGLWDWHYFVFSEMEPCPLILVVMLLQVLRKEFPPELTLLGQQMAPEVTAKNAPKKSFIINCFRRKQNGAGLIKMD